MGLDSCRFEATMTAEKQPRAFILRLPASTHLQAIEVAADEGVSLNQFINLAVAEKLARLEKKASSRLDDTR
jgi:predicted HicB family RNase H-like nuclease